MAKKQITYTRRAVVGIVLVIITFALLSATVLQFFSAAARVMSYQGKLGYGIILWVGAGSAPWIGLKCSSIGFT